MTTDELLNLISRQALGSAFQSEIQNTYQRNVDAEDYGTVESDYTVARDALTEVVSKEKLLLLAEYEESCKNIREFSASFGFIGGLFCGFKQYFTSDQAYDGGFFHHVQDEIGKLPNMKRHTENYVNIEHRNNVYTALAEGENEAVQDHLVSIDCAWEQRIYSASIDGYLCGYRGALAIIDQMIPPDGSTHIRSKQMSMERFFGYIPSERRNDCEELSC